MAAGITIMKQYIKIIIISIIFGGLTSILADRFLFPYLSSRETFNRYKFLKNAVETTTIINKTEEVVVKDDESIFEILSKINSGTVAIRNKEDKTLGTGLILTSDGLIVSLGNLLSGVDKENLPNFFAVFNDGSKAPIVSADTTERFSVIKVDKSNLSAVNILNDAVIRPGERVVIFGRGTDQEKEIVSKGIVNYYDQSLKIIHTDAKNYPALLGAGIFNAKGELVAMNTSSGADVAGITLPAAGELIKVISN